MGICTYDDTMEDDEEVEEAEYSAIPHFIAEQFDTFLTKYSKTYTSFELDHRIKIYYENYLYVETYNSNQDNEVTLALNQFADLTSEEFYNLYVNGKDHFKQERSLNVVELDEVNLPSSVDWRTKNAVTPVKN